MPKVSSITYYIKAIVSFESLKLIANSLKWYVEDYLVPNKKLTVEKSSFIHPSVNLKSPENIIVGHHVRIQPHVFLWASPKGKIVIGDYSGIGPGTKLFSSNHKYDFGALYIKQPWVERDIIIGDNVWIGANCVIMAGVCIHNGAVVAAGSVVTRDIPENTLVAGVPAKVLPSSSLSDFTGRSENLDV